MNICIEMSYLGFGTLLPGYRYRAEFIACTNLAALAPILAACALMCLGVCRWRNSIFAAVSVIILGYSHYYLYSCDALVEDLRDEFLNCMAVGESEMIKATDAIFDRAKFREAIQHVLD